MFDVDDRVVEPPAAVEDLAPSEVVEELGAVLVRIRRLEAQAAELLQTARETGAYRYHGYSSLTAMLAHRMSLHPGAAQRLVARAHGLADASLTSLAYARGAVSTHQVEVLLEAKSVAPKAFARDEADLVETAMDTPLVADLRTRVDYWLQTVAADEVAANKNLVRDLRSLRLHRDGDMMRIHGWFDLETGETIRTALEPPPPATEDTRPTPVRRADLLADIINGATGQPHVTIHVTLDTLTQSQPTATHPQGTLPGGDLLSETDTGVVLTPDQVTRLCCDANIRRVVFGPESEILDVGRNKRLVTPALRAAVIARDRRCIFPGCDRAPTFCDIHHLTHWKNGGETTLDNLVLLCRRHHTLIHQDGWKLKGKPGGLRVYRPDGTQLGTEPPPRTQKNPIIEPKPPNQRPTDLAAAIRRLPKIPDP